MATYKSPDVYIEEISLFPPSVAEVATAIPVFIGHTEKKTRFTTDDLVNVPTRITSMLEFEEIYGKAKNESITVTITDVTKTDAATGDDVLDKRTITAALASPSGYNLYYHMQMFFANGGGPCYITCIGSLTDAVTKIKFSNALDEVQKIDEITLLVMLEAIGFSDSDRKDLNYKSITQCSYLKDSFSIFDVETSTSTAMIDSTDFRDNNVSADDLKYGAAYYPSLETTLSYLYDEATLTAVYNVGPNPLTNPTITNGYTISAIKSNDTLAYSCILTEIAKIKVKLYPSGAVAGVYARVDSTRGVWKAPANVSIKSVVGPTKRITNLEQDDMNVDATSGKSINAIRAFSGKGTLVWGARTLAGNDNEWRYVPVRRFFNMVEESVKKSTYWAVFEPNDANTWVKVKAMIENYLILKWKDGALQGAKPEHAFFVKVGLGETMTALDILEGRMNVEIGMAVVRPAEFIILKFSHKLAES